MMNPPDATITFPENWVLAPGGARLSGEFFLFFFFFPNEIERGSEKKRGRRHLLLLFRSSKCALAPTAFWAVLLRFDHLIR